MSLAEIVDLLACPHCAAPMQQIDRTVGCASGHRFDIAKQGYVNLSTGGARQANADTPAMVAARTRFLQGGHYATIADRIADLATPDPTFPEPVEGPTSPDPTHLTSPEPVEGPRILDAGAGTGYYLSAVLDRLPAARGIATDLSPAASRRAARSHDRLGAVVADTWAGLPIADSALDLIMVVFAPRHPSEFARLLRPDGRLLVVNAADEHLVEIRDRLGLLDVQAGKRDRLQESLRAAFEPGHIEQLTVPMSLTAGELLDLVSMGPNAHHQSGQLRQRIDDLLPPVEVTAAAELSVFHRRSGGIGPG